MSSTALDPRGPRRARVEVGFALTALAVAAGVAWAMLARYEHEQREAWRQRLSSLAEERKSGIEALLSQRLDDTSYFATFPATAAALALPLGSVPSAPSVEHLTFLLEEARRRWKARSAIVVDRTLAVRAASGAPLDQYTIDFLRRLSPTEPAIGLVGPPEALGLLFTAPVLSKPEGSELGRVVFVDDPAVRLWPILTREPMPTASGETLLTRRRGEGVTILSPVREQRALGPGRSVHADPRLAGLVAASGTEVFAELTDYRGVSVLAATRHLPLANWGLVAKIDRDEALSGRSRERSWAALALVLLAVALSFLVRAARSTARLNFSEQMRRLGERHRSVLEQMRDAVVWVDPTTGRIREVNRAATELWGYSRDELLALDIGVFRQPGHEAEAFANLAAAREGRQAFFRARNRRRDGSTFAAEVSARMVDLEGEPILVAMTRDVSESESAFARVVLLNRLLRTIGNVNQVLVQERNSERFLQRVCETVVREGELLMSWIGLDKEGSGRIVPVASAGRVEGFLDAITIRYRDEIEGDDPAGTAWRERRSVVVADWAVDSSTGPWREAALARGYRSSAACPVLVGGEVVAVFALYAGEPSYFVPEVVSLLEELSADLGLALDLAATERRHRQSEVRFRRFMDNLPAAAFLKDADSRVVWANRFLTSLLARGELAGRDTLEVVPSGPAERMVDDDRRVLDGESVEQLEQLLTSDGELRQFRTLKFAVPGPNGERLIGGISTDLTERIRAEDEIRRLNTELEARVEQRTAELLAKSRELESFAYSVSHDLRAPLRAIDGFSLMLEEDYGGHLEADGQRLLGVVRESARRMGRLIDDLLAFSRAGRHELKRALVDTPALVRSVLDEVLPAADRERSELLLGELPSVSADPALLRQVFVNLLSNAVKFSSGRERRTIEVRGTSGSGWATYEIRDNGVGFDMQYAKKLFGVFQRLHGREFEGTGVGLALVQRIIERHGGSIRAEAEVDGGAIFTFRLPADGDSE